MNKKKIIYVIIAIFTFAIITKGVILAAPSLNVSSSQSGNNATLHWTNSDEVEVYSYNVKRSVNGGGYTSIYDTNAEPIKVLNVYPGTGDNISFQTHDGQNVNIEKSGSLKKWMEERNSEDENGYGRGLISVIPVTIDRFNSNISEYLSKDADGNYNYDVLFFGTWDENGKKDLTIDSARKVEEFINSGRGVIFGHDTLSTVTTDALNHPNFATLAKYVNLTTASSWIDNGDTEVVINKTGVFTTYPWNIGTEGVKLTIPRTHNLGQTANGNIWLKFDNNVLQGNQNFYLTTWNNTAMIQTGHSNCEATPDEQKILANLIFYLADLSKDNEIVDNDFRDINAPNIPTIKNKTLEGTSGSVSYTAEDNGTEYKYYVEAMEKISKTELTSNVTTQVRKTGVAGYSYVVDNKSNTVPDNIIDTTDTQLNYTLTDGPETWLHIQAIDGAGNVGSVIHELLNSYGNKQTTVTLVFNQENPNDDGYTNIGIYELDEFEVGENVVDIEDIEKVIIEQFNKIKFDEQDYFIYNEEKSIKELNKEIKQYSNNIVNLYFDRKEYSINFIAGKIDENRNYISKIYTSDLEWVGVNNTITFHLNGGYYPNSYMLTAKYGQDISNIWPTHECFFEVGNKENEYSFIGWRTDEKSKYYLNNEDKNILYRYDIMSKELIIDPNDSSKVHEMYGIWSCQPKYYKLHFLYECLNQEEQSNTCIYKYDGKIYREQSTEIIKNSNGDMKLNLPIKPEFYMVYTEKIKDDTSYSGTEGNPIEMYVYYNRKEYNLIFYNVNCKYVPTSLNSALNNKGIYLREDENGVKKVIVKYGADISSLSNLHNEWQKDEYNQLKYPYAIEIVETVYFKGWCDSFDLLNEFEWNSVNFLNYDNEIYLFAYWIVERINR